MRWRKRSSKLEKRKRCELWLSEWSYRLPVSVREAQKIRELVGILELASRVSYPTPQSLGECLSFPTNFDPVGSVDCDESVEE